MNCNALKVWQMGHILQTRTLAGLLQIALSEYIVPLPDQPYQQLSSLWRIRVSKCHKGNMYQTMTVHKHVQLGISFSA